jgi:hypothetical protein
VQVQIGGAVIIDTATNTWRQEGSLLAGSNCMLASPGLQILASGTALAIGPIDREHWISGYMRTSSAGCRYTLLSSGTWPSRSTGKLRLVGICTFSGISTVRMFIFQLINR